MQCVICKQGETKSGVTVVKLQSDNHTMVIKGVPAEICGNCGEYYLSQEIMDSLHQQAGGIMEHAVDAEIERFAAPAYELAMKF